MRVLVFILSLLLCINNIDAQQKVDISIRISASKRMSDVLDEIEKQTSYSFIYDARIIDLSRRVYKPLEGNSIYELLNLLFKDTDVVFTIVNDQIILNKKDAIVRMQQQSSIKVAGVVVSKNGEPIVGATVVEKGTTNGTITDHSGRFVLDLPMKSLVQVSCLGYYMEEVGYDGQSALRVKLRENALQLEEVVVTALGLHKKEASLTYATQFISGEELLRAKEPNFIHTLTGKTAGVQINKTASGLGGSAKVVIRGNRSASGNNQPLYVIDGVPILNSTSEQPLTVIGGTADAGNRDGGDGISNLNPEDIESLNILKGASAAALYGAQAANGVILVTTKKGKAGVQRVNFSSSLTIDKAMSLPKFQNEYGRIEGSSTSWGGSERLPVYDNLKDFFRNGITAINALSFTSGSDKIQSYFSYANTTALGIVDKNNMNKHNFNLRESAGFFGNRLLLDGSANVMIQTINNKPAAGGFYMNPLQGLYTFPRGMDITPYRENFEVYSDKRNMPVQNWYASINDFEQNPYWLVNRVQSVDKRARALVTLSTRLEVNDWLVLQGRGSVDYLDDVFRQKIYASTSSGIAGVNGRYIDQSYKEMLLYGDLMAVFNNSWKDFSLNAAIGTSLADTRCSMLRLDSKTASLYYPNVFTIANINMSSSAYIDEQNDARRQMQSVFATAQVGYRESLYVDVTARNDWSSTLAYTKSKLSGFFYPSVGISWVIGQTFELPEQITFGKVRASWSKVGNDIPLFVSNYPDRIVAGGTIRPGNTAPFDNLKPEMSSSFEVGTEWHFCEQRVDLDITYYKTNTRNQLFTLPSSAGAAYKYYFVNAGNIQNSGVEASLGIVPLVADRFRWKTQFTFSRNLNVIKKLHKDLLAFGYGDEGFSSSYTMRLVEGGSFGDIYGKAFVRDAYGAIVFDEDGLPKEYGSGNTAKVGNSNPDCMLGWGNTIYYRDFKLYFLLDGRFGGDVLSQTQAVLDQSGVSKASGDARQEGYVDLEGKHIYNVRAFYEHIGGRSGTTEYYMYDATTVRLRELSLGYNIPERLISKYAFFKKAELSFVARNLFFLYKQAPFDPDAVLSTYNGNQGVDIFGIPTTRNIGFNIKLSF